ncbi:MAG: cupredoxin domain-containing protein [Rhodospirillales bacterium]|nr:cupredoxin domain-containing protein [Rhodospirillales bacterium]
MGRSKDWMILAVAAAVGAAAPLVVRGDQGERVIRIEAQQFEYKPEEVVLKKGEPVILELVSLDRVHGFNMPSLGIRAEIGPYQSTRIRLVPDKTGRFAFHCDMFCGGGHDEMDGRIVVVE